MQPQSHGFTVFGYKLLAAQFSNGQPKRLSINELSVEPLPPDFRSLGFDVVNKTLGASSECSPLSCNGMASEIPVNQYCLLGGLAEAVALAVRFSRDEPEPGPYYVVEILR